ncbi:hypothetical protein LTR04_005213 [Oleoguttula sp. CCFEE 6159]|nr:hypothetical protein LTR04_005213 [Oleoguttula sp. CCFEE 6159]
MAIRYDEHFQDKASDFGHIRDSFYILMTMNQYTMNPWIPLKKEAEGLLRIALFSKDLRLHKESRRLQEVRRDLAADLRGRRKRGAVPVYISTMWFLFSLGISIQSAFGYVGENATAHDLALGLMLAWMPVLILCSIVDRNPVAADDIRRKLNKLVDKVRASLVDDSIREDFINTFEHRPEGDAMKHWVTDIRNQCENMESFFVAFAGQGRVRYHHGVAHPILSDIESIYIAKHGRDWLRNEREARYNLVLGMPSDEGLLWFDFRELWQIASAVLIVGCTCLGAFILSYFTPTVGLGCRSFGYTVFASISFGLLICEGFVWWLASNARTPHAIARIRTRMVSNTAYQGLESRSIGFAKKVSLVVHKVLKLIGKHVLRGYLLLLSPFVKSDTLESQELRIQRMVKRWQEYGVQEWTDRCVLRPGEIINTIWLIYIVLAQTFGAYETCKCMSSTHEYGTDRGYMDFTQWAVTNSDWVKGYWTGGTVLASGVMSIGMVYIVAEWCLQSHLSTEDYDDAWKGLRRTRRFRRFTHPYRWVIGALITEGKWLWYYLTKLFNPETNARSDQRSLVWTKDITYHNNPTIVPPQRVGDVEPSRGESTPLLLPPTIHEPPATHFNNSIVDISPRNSSEAVTLAPSINSLEPPRARPVYWREFTDSSSGS